MPRYYCDYCDTYLTHDSVSLSLSLSLKLFGAFGLYVCLFKDLCQYWTKSCKCDDSSYVWYCLLIKVWFFLYTMSFTSSGWVYLCELDRGLRLKLNCYSYYYLLGSSIWWVLCCGDLLGSYDFQNAKNALYTLFKFVVAFKSVSQSLQFSPSNIIMTSMCSYCHIFAINLPENDVVFCVG